MKQGFFDLGTGDTLDSIRHKSINKKQGCEGCGLFRECNSPKMEVTGKGVKKILIVGEKPSKQDDQDGAHFVDRGGKILEEALGDLGIRMRRDCRIINAVNCRPSGNRTPTDSEIADCRERVLKEIREMKPAVILVLGVAAVQSVIGHRTTGRLKGVSNSAFYSEQIPDQEYGAWVCPTYHPTFFLYEDNRDDEVTLRIWKNDLKKAVELAENPQTFPILDIKSLIHCTDEVETARKWLKTVIDEASEIAFDYETTGIKPHKQGHKIVTVSIGYEDGAYSFPFFDDSSFLSLWKNIMCSEEIGKIAHKADFEANWTRVCLGYWPKNLIWDTCLGAHCLDNRKKTSLKFHTYTRLGVIGYDDGAHTYITQVKSGEDKDSKNHINCVQDAPVSTLLPYNAMDSWFTWLLYQDQKKRLKGARLTGFRMFIEGTQTLAKIHQNGMRIDAEQLEIETSRLTKRMNKLELKIREQPEATKWVGTGKDKYAEFNFNSHTQLARLLYEILDFKKPRKGGKTDEKALKKLSNPFTDMILQYRKYKKIRDTYLAQYRRETVDGIIHPFFNLHLVSTFRSSSDSPNFQNIPKRDLQTKSMVRSLFLPQKGCRLVEWDYKGVEVCISACYHQDPVMIKYITDPTTDMHRDTARDLFMKSEVTKHERYVAKNGFVFPSFYGSTARPQGRDEIGIITQNLWDEVHQETRDHLQASGIDSIQDFQKHVEEIEKRFWDERFKIYSEWKRKTYQDYRKKGYVDLKTGFRCYGPLKFTEVTNYPIQGSAFHVLLWSLNQVLGPIQGISGRSTIIGQIHDAVVGSIHPEDEAEADRLMNLWGTEKVRELWPWIIVPLKIEKERSPVDGTWDEMEECEL